MSKVRVEAAAMIALSAQSAAIVYGPGKLILERGGRTMYFNEREARALVEEWLRYDEARRAPAPTEAV